MPILEHMKRTCFFLPEPLLAELRELSMVKDISVAELVRSAAQQFVRVEKEKEEAKRRAKKKE